MKLFGATIMKYSLIRFCSEITCLADPCLYCHNWVIQTACDKWCQFSRVFALCLASKWRRPHTINRRLTSTLNWNDWVHILTSFIICVSCLFKFNKELSVINFDIQFFLMSGFSFSLIYIFRISWILLYYWIIRYVPSYNVYNILEILESIWFIIITVKIKNDIKTQDVDKINNFLTVKHLLKKCQNSHILYITYTISSLIFTGLTG